MTLLHRSYALPETSGTHRFFSRAEAESMPSLLKKPYKHFIEMREYVQLGKVLSFIRDEYPHISLSLTTKTVFRQPVADFFIALLLSQRELSTGCAQNIRTCVQEALMNSVIHGNLAIVQEHNTPSGFQRYREKITRQIEDEILGLKRISLFAWLTEKHITLCIADQGRGFDLMKPETEGHGLALIRGIPSRVWQTEPNHLYMQFADYG